jgi:transcriptional regulator
MYLPKHFAEERPGVLHGLIKECGLATLVTVKEGLPYASHLPFILMPDPLPNGRLTGHLARANPQVQGLRAGEPALAIFQGPDAYVSPNYYPSKKVAGKAVPSWNYVAIHVYGELRLIEDPAGLEDILTRLTDQHEAKRPHPWKVADAPRDYLETMMKNIVGLELRITRLEGKWKLSQNKTPEDRAGVIAGMEASAKPSDRATAQAMRERE